MLSVLWPTFAPLQLTTIQTLKDHAIHAVADKPDGAPEFCTQLTFSKSFGNSAFPPSRE